jgi:DNA-binding transcriptional MerR regulator
LNVRSGLRKHSIKIAGDGSPACTLYYTLPMLPSEKMFYTIGEVAQMLGVSTSMIRFWEKEFDILKPKKNAKGNRLFRPNDVENIKTIYHLVKERGFTLQGARDKLAKNKQDVIEKASVVDGLKRIRTFLTDVKNAL